MWRKFIVTFSRIRVVWGSHFEYLLREKLNVSKEQFATLDDDRVKDILNALFADLSFRRTMELLKNNF